MRISQFVKSMTLGDGRQILLACRLIPADERVARRRFPGGGAEQQA